MRIFLGLFEANREIERDLKETGVWIRGFSYQDKIVKGDSSFDFMELCPYVYSLTDWSDREAFIRALNLNDQWIEAEFYERLEGLSNPGEAWKLRPDVWAPFIQENGQFAYTYGERMRRNSVLKTIGRELQIHPASRQCIIPIFRGSSDIANIGGKKRIPCSIFYQFMVRDDVLILHYVMRSCDFYTHFPYDQLLAIRLLDHMGDSLGYSNRRFTHIITSLHAFRKDFPQGVF